MKPNLVGRHFKSILVIERIRPSNAKWLGHDYEWYLCRCDCGATFEMSGRDIKYGKGSCGCNSKIGQFKAKYSQVDSIVQALISRYKIKAKKRGLIWDLSFSQAKKLFLSPCYYCHLPPSAIVTSYLHTGLAGGIDRVDNAIGYTPLNTVSCCKICNRAKLTASIEVFLSWIARIKTYQKQLVLNG